MNSQSTKKRKAAGGITLQQPGTIRAAWTPTTRLNRSRKYWTKQFKNADWRRAWISSEWRDAPWRRPWVVASETLQERIYQVWGVKSEYHFETEAGEWLTLSDEELRQTLESERFCQALTEDQKREFFEEMKRYVERFNQINEAWDQVAGQRKGLYWFRLYPSEEIYGVLIRQEEGGASA